MLQIRPTDVIDEERMSRVLLAQRTIRERFRLPMTEAQAVSAIRAGIMAETAVRGCRAVFDEEMTRCIVEAARVVTEGGRQGMLLCGMFGNGKSTMMRAVCSVIVVCGMRDSYGEHIVPRHVDARDVARIMKDDYGLYKKVRGCSVLAIDDLGTEPREVLDFGTPISPMVELLSYRYEEQLFTMMTTNLTPRDIRERYGGRIADRFNEMVAKIEFAGASYRGRELRI